MGVVEQRPTGCRELVTAGQTLQNPAHLASLAQTPDPRNAVAVTCHTADAFRPTGLNQRLVRVILGGEYLSNITQIHGVLYSFSRSSSSSAIAGDGSGDGCRKSSAFC